MVLVSSLFKGSVFIIALGVWFALTIASSTGIQNVDKAYLEAARTLGAKGHQLVFRVAIPHASGDDTGNEFCLYSTSGC